MQHGNSPEGPVQAQNSLCCHSLHASPVALVSWGVSDWHGRAPRQEILRVVTAEAPGGTRARPQRLLLVTAHTDQRKYDFHHFLCDWTVGQLFDWRSHACLGQTLVSYRSTHIAPPFTAMSSRAGNGDLEHSRLSSVAVRPTLGTARGAHRPNSQAVRCSK